MARIHFVLPATLAAVLLLVGYAITSEAQPPYVPNPYAIVSPTGGEIIKAENTGTYVSTVNIAQLRDAAGYAILTGATAPTTGTTFTVPANTSVVYGNPAGTLAAWTVKTPPAPVDGERLQVFSSQIITAFSLAANTGQTVNASPMALAANGNIEFIYQLSSLTWFRIQ